MITWPGEPLLESCRNNCAMLSYDASSLKSPRDNYVVSSYDEMARRCSVLDLRGDRWCSSVQNDNRKARALGSRGDSCCSYVTLRKSPLSLQFCFYSSFTYAIVLFCFGLSLIVSLP